MSGDHSRFVYDPARDFNGVLLQQGRPLTDWDWNDSIAQANRRARVTAYDTFGPAAVVPSTTPNGFQLLPSGAEFTIGRGRVYVDGLLAENHGAPPAAWNSGAAWDAALAETYGTQPVAYSKQPYLPNPKALPTSGGPYLLYLDVWERELTSLQGTNLTSLCASDLVDKALGVDTTTRVQNVWQVKWLSNDQHSPITCDTDLGSLAAWKALVAPSAGRLTNATATYGTDNPCLIPPTGGYTGLENQLYRVQIHTGGKPGTATFKWSRDNASIETRVTSMPTATTLVVESVGKDDVLGFHDGDWIELLDDWLEFGDDTSNLPGELHQIVLSGGVDAATRTITLTSGVTSGRFITDPAAGRNTRIRRWDQGGANLNGDGSITVPASSATQVQLENGIVVSFAVAQAGGVFRPGDWWVFAARASDASIEPLDHAPPRGIHHHYARLGVFTPGSAPTNCVQHWPPPSGGDSCACTICVSPAAHAQSSPSLQQAINTVIQSGGGTVCLEAGDYPLSSPLLVQRASTLTLRGQGQATKIRPAGTAIRVVESKDVTLEDFQIAWSTDAADPRADAIEAVNVTDLRIRGLDIEAPRSWKASIGVALSGRIAGLVLDGNRISMPVGLCSGILVDGRLRAGTVALSGARIENNVFECTAEGIRLSLDDSGAAPLFVLRNRFVLSSIAAIGLTGNNTTGGIEITGNRLAIPGSGITTSLPGVRILDNDLACTTNFRLQKSNVGIHLANDATASTGTPTSVPTPENGGVSLDTSSATATGPSSMRMRAAHIVGNRLLGFLGAGIQVEAPLRELQIKQNQIEYCGDGIEVADPGAALMVSIENNQVQHCNVLPTGEDRQQLVGIGVRGARNASITGNSISDLGRSDATGLIVGGIVAARCAAVRIAGNDIADLGPLAGDGAMTIGIAAVPPFDDVSVDGNFIRRATGDGHSPPPYWIAILFGVDLAVLSALFRDTRSTNSSSPGTTTAVLNSFLSNTHVVARGTQVSTERVENPEGAQSAAPLATDTAASPTATAAVSTSPVTAAPASGATATAAVAIRRIRATIRGNQVSAIGPSSMALGQANGIDFSNNQYLHAATAPEDRSAAAAAIALELSAQTLVFGGNNIRNLPRTRIVMMAPKASFTVLGNITATDILVAGAVLGAPWKPLNMQTP